MTIYGITPAGFVKKPGSVIRSEIESDYRGIYGENIQTTDGPLAQEIGVLAEREALIWELAESIYLAGTRAGAEGQSLDDVNGRIGVGRLGATRSTVTLTLATDAAVTVPVPAGSQARQINTNTLFETTAAVVIPAASNVVTATCTDITHQSGNTVRYQLASGTDLSGVSNGDMLAVTGAAIPSNNGLFAITNISDGSDYVDVTNGARSDSAGNEASIAADAVITDGYITAAAQAVNTGPNAATFGTIKFINTPVSNWSFVSNQQAATTGRNRENDTDYRRRAAASTVSTDGGTLAAVRNRLLSEVAGVTAVFARENVTNAVDGNGLPGHSQQYTVIGGADQDIANLIYAAKPAGIATFGNTSATVTNDYDSSETVFWSRVTAVPIYFIANITHDSAYPTDGDDQVKAALLAYGDVLGPGDDVINAVASGYITVNVPGVTGITLLQGTSDPPGASTNISISATQNATFALADITVNS